MTRAKGKKRDGIESLKADINEIKNQGFKGFKEGIVEMFKAFLDEFLDATVKMNVAVEQMTKNKMVIEDFMKQVGEDFKHVKTDYNSLSHRLGAIEAFGFMRGFEYDALLRLLNRKKIVTKQEIDIEMVHRSQEEKRTMAEMFNIDFDMLIEELQKREGVLLAERKAPTGKVVEAGTR